MTTVDEVKAWLARNRWPVVEVENKDAPGRLSNAYGIGPRVELQRGLEEPVQMITLLHECAHIWLGHYQLHDSVWPTREEHMVREVEAETIAMKAAEYLGRPDLKELSHTFLENFPQGLVDEERMSLIAISMSNQIRRL